jgi:hypothetical protein
LEERKKINRKAMKLYTEEQVRETISNTLRIINSEKTWTYDDVINLLRPIELPTDEEIEKTAKIFWPQANESSLIRCWILGAKWYREQLKTNN